MFSVRRQTCDGHLLIGSQIARRSFHTNFFVVIVLLLALNLFQIPIESSLRLVIILWLLASFGLQLARHIGISEPTLATCIALGSVVFVLCVQTLLAQGTSAFTSHLLVVSVFVLLALIRLAGFKRLPTKLNTTEILYVVSIALIVFSSWHLWFVPFACASTLVAYLTERLPSKLHVLLLGPCILFVGWLLSNVIRPENWEYFFQGNDSQFFESVSWTTATWGLQEHPGYFHGSIKDYHWFSYAFLGSLSHGASLQPWDALLKVGPVLVMVLIGSSLAQHKLSLLHRQTQVAFVVILLSTRITTSSRFDSFGFSIAVGLILLQFVERIHLLRRRITPLLVFILLYIQLALSKVSTLIVVALLIYLVLLAKERRKELSSKLLMAGIPLTTLLLFLLIFKSSNNASVLSRVATTSEIKMAMLNLLSDTSRWIEVGLVVFVWCFLKRDSHKRETLAFLAMILIPLWLGYEIVFSSGTSIYFGSAALSLGFLCAIANVLSYEKVRRVLTNWRIRMVLVVLFAILTGFGRPELELLVRRLPDVGFITSSTPRIFALCIPLLFIVTLASSFWVRTQFGVLLIAITFCFGLLLGQSFRAYWYYSNSEQSLFTFTEANSAPFGSRGLIALSRFVREAVPTDALLASNNFCCASTEWWEHIEDNPSAHSKSPHEEIRWGGANYLLPAYTRRRFLLQGLRFQAGYGIPSSEQMNRMRISLDFANKPNSSTNQELKSYGVTYFIVNLTLTERRNWEPFAHEIFRQAEFILLKLK